MAPRPNHRPSGRVGADDGATGQPPLDVYTTPMATKKSRSGTQWSDDDYAAAGYSRLSLRLPAEVKARLQRLAEMSGWSVAELVDHMSAAEEKRRKARSSKKST